MDSGEAPGGAEGNGAATASPDSLPAKTNTAVTPQPPATPSPPATPTATPVTATLLASPPMPSPQVLVDAASQPPATSPTTLPQPTSNDTGAPDNGSSNGKPAETAEAAPVATKHNNGGTDGGGPSTSSAANKPTATAKPPRPKKRKAAPKATAAEKQHKAKPSTPLAAPGDDDYDSFDDAPLVSALHKHPTPKAKAKQQSHKPAPIKLKVMSLVSGDPSAAVEPADDPAGEVPSQPVQKAPAKKKKKRKQPHAEASAAIVKPPAVKRYAPGDKLPPEIVAIKRTRLWEALCKRDISKAHKLYVAGRANAASNAKRVADMCRKRVRKTIVDTSRPCRETPRRCKRLMQEMSTFWRKADKLDREHRRKTAKERNEQRRLEEEKREAQRQHRKLNFLVTQTELYAHFMANKLDGVSEEDARQKRDEILSRLEQTPAPQTSEDPQDVDDDVLKQRALSQAHAAVAAHDASVHNSAAAPIDNEQLSLAHPKNMGKEITQPTMFNGTLKAYQLKGVSWLVNLYEQGINGILADEMGLGKTVQSIGTVAHLVEAENIWGPFLVVAPASTLHNWQQEFARFLPDLKVLPYWGNPKQRKLLRKKWSDKHLHKREAAFHVVITNYQLIILDEKYFSRVSWQYMILDEAQAIKSSSSVRWSTLLKFKCRNRLLLTGTPIQNNMAELWALLHFIMPSLFDSLSEFNEWFSKDIESHASSSKNSTLDKSQLMRLHMILQPFMLRRVKKDVENELAAKIELKLDCPLSRRQRLLYDGIKRQLSSDDVFRSVNLDKQAQRILNYVMQLRKICNHAELMQRREVSSPFVFEGPRWKCASRVVTRAPPMPSVVYNTENAIEYTLPTLVFADVAHGSVAESRLAVVRRMSMFSPDNVLQSSLEGGLDGCFSFSRLIELSPAELFEAAARPAMTRWLRLCLVALHAAHASPFAEDAKPTRRRLRVIQRCWGTAASWQVDKAVLWGSEGCSAAAAPYARWRCTAPAVIAPPIAMHVSHRSAEHHRQSVQHMSDADLAVGNWRGRSLPPSPDVSELLDGNALRDGPLWDARGPAGWSHIQLPDSNRLLADSGKMAVLDTLLRRLHAEGHRVLIYSQMTKMIDILEEYMVFRRIKFMRLDGTSKISERRDMVADFQNRDDIFVFLLSTRAGGLGINLTAADTVIFYDSDWNPTVDQQAMDRAHRLGQKRQVTVYRLIAGGTVEERMLQRAHEKSKIQQMVITGEGGDDDALGTHEMALLLLDDVGEPQGKATGQPASEVAAVASAPTPGREAPGQSLTATTSAQRKGKRKTERGHPQKPKKRKAPSASPAVAAAASPAVAPASPAPGDLAAARADVSGAGHTSPARSSATDNGNTEQMPSPRLLLKLPMQNPPPPHQ
eukprot:m.311871 g.311871  ORF g.311871 m.311871 type:complete len:1376 (-) comp19655_c0_seq3:43-4170(-)